MTNINLEYWLFEQDMPMLGGQPDPMGGQPPTSMPGMPQDPMGTGNQIQDPNQIPPDPNQSPMVQNVTDDPQTPDMPEEEETPEDFGEWKMYYIKQSSKGDPNVLIDMIMQIRDRELEPADRKFVEDNLQVNFLRSNYNILEASKEIRKLIKQELDHTNPGTSLVSHITNVLEKFPLLNELYIKINGLYGLKGDVHRKFLASLIGAVQVGSGADVEDIIFEEKEYSIKMSTRVNSRFGDIKVGNWVLKEDDPERYLKGIELRRLQEGSPEEKDILRRRVVIDSISDYYQQRAFLIDVIGEDGTIYHIGWDLGNSLQSAYNEGRLVVRTKTSDNSEAIIDDEGNIIPNLDWYIKYVKETGEIDEEGEVETEEIEFMHKKEGVLFLTAQLDILQEAAANIKGLSLNEVPYQGNPSDLTRIMRCVPSIPEILLRQC